MRAASNPWATRLQSAAILVWAGKYGCKTCDNSGWVSAGGLWCGIVRQSWDHYRKTGYLHF